MGVKRLVSAVTINTEPSVCLGNLIAPQGIRPDKKICVFPVTDRPCSIFIVVFGFLQLILLAEKCFQFQICFWCNLY